LTRLLLKYGAIYLELKNGEFYVGRGDDCNLVLDDSLVSRRHAVFRITDEFVEVEDLGSRNGVSVKNERIEKATNLQHNDRIQIGSQVMVLLDTSNPRFRKPLKHRADSRTVELRLCPSCSTPIDSRAKRCPHCETDIVSFHEKKSVQRKTKSSVSSVEKPRKPSALTLIQNIADKAIHMGHYDEAERILNGMFDEILSRADEGQPIDDEKYSKATQYSLRLAEVTSKPKWLEVLFRMHSSLGRLMSSETIDTLYRLSNVLRKSNPMPLRVYISGMREISQHFTANQRFLLGRLEGLERQILNK